jgi:hypothetical protein
MKRKIAALLFGGMMLVRSVSPALAVTDRPRPIPPSSPRGSQENVHENRPADVETPLTGPVRDPGTI